MSEKTRVMVMGGHTTAYHDFSIMGPIYRDFLGAAGFDVTLTENRDDFRAEALRPYDVIICYTTGENLTPEQASGLLEGIMSGKGFIGVHSATASFKETPGYISMLGARFLTHPSYLPRLTFTIKNRHHPVVEGVEDFQMEEELYLMETSGHFDLLVATWFDGFERPIAWVKPYGHGRVLYTALGHARQQTEHPCFQRLIVNGVRWAANPEARRDAPPG
jgi:type 1 glutamine amidotransferase